MILGIDPKVDFAFKYLLGRDSTRSIGSIRPTISISFLNHVLFPEVPDYHLRFHLLEDHHHFAMSQDIEFHVLELPKFTKSLTQLAGGLDIWLYFLRLRK